MPHHPGERTYNFKDMTGETRAGVLVLEQAESTRAGSRWHIKHACGHTEIVQGFALRAADKAGTKRRCFVCRPKHQPAGA